MQEEQKQGRIDSGTSLYHLQQHAARTGMDEACNSMLFNPPSYEVVEHFNSKIIAAADQRGETFTEKHGCMRGFNGASAAKARARNTGIEHGAMMDLYESAISGTSLNHRRGNGTTSCDGFGSGSPLCRHEDSTTSVGVASAANDDSANADADAMFEYCEDGPSDNATIQEALTPDDVNELRLAVEEATMFGDQNDTIRRKKLHQLSLNLHMKELPKQTQSGLAVLERKNITDPTEKINLLLNQIQLDD